MFIQYRIVTMVQHLVDTQCQFEKHLHSLVFVFFLKNSFESKNDVGFGSFAHAIFALIENRGALWAGFVETCFVIQFNL